MKEVKWTVRQTGYDQDDTQFLVTQKDAGTGPNIKVYQSGQYQGELTLSERGARSLLEVLSHLVFAGPKGGA